MPLSSELVAALPAQLPLALGWLLYALLHSLTASIRCKEFCRRRWPRFFAGYRLLYNALALALLIPLAGLSIQTPGPQLWVWTGAMAWLLNGLAAFAFLAFLRGGGGYDLRAFLGLRPQVRGGAPCLVISQWHRFVRHPWYSIALVLIWTRDMNAASLVSAIAITLYFVIGSRLEENKLVAEFGERYREYQRRVPRLVPLPGRVLSREDARRLAG